MRPPLAVTFIGRSDALSPALRSIGDRQVDGEADAAVVAVDLPAPAALSSLDASDWDVGVGQALRRALSDLNDARRSLRGGRGAIVVVVPVIGIAGAANLVALTTVVEGVRALAKSAARQWAPEGVSVNLLCLPASLLDPELEAHTSHLPPAPGGTPSWSDVEEVLGLLLAPPTTMVGATLVLDGGSVMAP